MKFIIKKLKILIIYNVVQFKDYSTKQAYKFDLKMGFTICIYGLKKEVNNDEQQYDHLYDFSQSYNGFDRRKNDLRENLNDSFEEDLFEAFSDIWRNPMYQSYILNGDEYCSLSRIKKIFDDYGVSYNDLSDEFKQKFQMILYLFDYDSEQYSDIFMFAE